MSAPVVIIDNGSGFLKSGFSNETSPSSVIPTLIGRLMLRYQDNGKLPEIDTETLNKLNSESSGPKELYIGKEVLTRRAELELSHPIAEGIIRNKSDLAALWKYTLMHELKLSEEKIQESRVMLTEAPMNPINNKIDMCDIMFEELEVAMLNIEPQAKLSLFCDGIDTGMVWDSGDGVTHCIPISNGTILTHYIERLNIAGRHITEYWIKWLQKKGYAFNSSADFETIREIKEKFCFVSNDIKSDREWNKNTTYYNSYYLLPDGRRIHISSEKYEAPEILFDPGLLGIDVDGVQEMVYRSIKNCPIDTRVGLYSHLLLSGATTLFPGFATRYENEMKRLYKERALKDAESKNIKIMINVVDTPKRKFSVFIGATIIANYYNTPDGGDYWITREEWLEADGNNAKEQILKEKCKSYFKDTYFKND